MMKRILNPGQLAAHTGALVPVFVVVQVNEGRLSITGVEGPTRGGNAYGGCGQIWASDGPQLAKLSPGWTHDMVAQLADVWREWHLNDMRAGSPAQRAYLGAHGIKGYEAARDALRAAGLSPDPSYIHNGKPYAYGSAWLSEPLPPEVLQFLESLPETDLTPAWC